MISVTHLDKDDIRSIIANYFKVSIDNVTVDCYMDWVGYGIDEHQEPAVRAVVEENRQEYRNSFEESIANGWIYG